MVPKIRGMRFHGDGNSSRCVQDLTLFRNVVGYQRFRGPQCIHLNMAPRPKGPRGEGLPELGWWK